MARLTGPDDRTVFLTAGANAGKAKAQGMSVPLYADDTLTTPADVRSMLDQVIPGTPPTLVVDEYSQIPLFKYPDGVDVVYTSINGGPATPLYARTDDRLDVLAPLQYPRSLPAGVVLGRLYEPARHSYNVTPASTPKFRAAVARALSGGPSARIVVVGDSITYGWGATSKPKRWTSVLQDLIVARLGVSVCGTGAIPILDAYNSAPVDTRFTGAGGGPTLEDYDADSGPGIMGTNGYIGTGQSLTFTPGRADIDQFILYYYRNPSSAVNALDVAVDNVYVNTLNCHNPAGYTVHKATYDVTPGVAHTIKFSATAYSGLLLAVEGRVNGGNGGCTVSAFGNPSHDVQHLINPGYPGANFAPALTQQGPDLTVVMLQTNDYTGPLRGFAQMPIADYTAAWQTAITTAKAAGGDVLIATEWPCGEDRPIAYSSYTRALYELADANDVPLVDNVAAAGTYAEANTLGMTGDLYHPNDRGYRLMALTMFGALSALMGDAQIAPAAVQAAAPAARKYKGSTTTVTPDTQQPVVLGVTQFNRDPAYLDTSTANAITVLKAGLYLVSAGLTFDGGASGYRGMLLKVNGVDTLEDSFTGTSGRASVVEPLILSPGDVVSMATYTSGSPPTNVFAGSSKDTGLSLTRIGG